VNQQIVKGKINTMAFMGLELAAKEEDAKRAKNEGYAQDPEAARTGHITIND